EGERAGERGTNLQALRPGRPWLALVTLIPMIWLISVTFTAGWQKIFHESPKIGFLAQAHDLDSKLAALQVALDAAKAGGEVAAVAGAQKAVSANRTLHFNNVLDACVAGIFLALVSLIMLISIREWVLLLARKKLAQLRETPPTWLPAYAIAEGKPFHVLGLFALLLALARELSGEAQMERARQATVAPCDCHHHGPRTSLTSGSPTEVSSEAQAVGSRLAKEDAYVKMLEDRFKGVRRCC
ncbi:MAG: hypothetical protein NTW03_01495, partial [Verrucomicrobia bacterium]|nr:hypothetical protein [Verrucomicrobiota bacterium]